MKTNRIPLRQLHMGCGEGLLARMTAVSRKDLQTGVLRTVRRVQLPVGKDKR